jgi:hypothetical protein
MASYYSPEAPMKKTCDLNFFQKFSTNINSGAGS